MAANGLAAIGGQVAEQVGPMPGSGQQLSATTQAILAATGGGGAFEPHAAFEHVRDGSPFHWHLDAHGAVAPTAPPSLSATSLPMFPYATTASNMYPTEETENAIAAAMAAANAAAAAFAMSRASVGTPVASATASKKAGKKGGEPTSIYRGVNWEVCVLACSIATRNRLAGAVYICARARPAPPAACSPCSRVPSSRTPRARAGTKAAVEGAH
ncbi:hypothetical protein EON68_00515 [archaeon]|nr:MAG: hypothetical protein EON68_00515 [archaeon]